jgi:hypothetical protein
MIKLRRMGRVVYDVCGGDDKRCRILTDKPEGKRPFGRPWHKSNGNVKMLLTEIGREVVG